MEVGYKTIVNISLFKTVWLQLDGVSKQQWNRMKADCYPGIFRQAILRI